MTEGFELRLLEELKLLVDAPGIEAAPVRRRWLPRSRFVVALAVVALVVGATAASIGAWRLAHENPHKAAIVSTLRRGGHVGPLVASSRGWSLYASNRGRGPTDAELSSRDDTVVSAFRSRKPIELTAVGDASSGFDALAGQVNAPRAASVALLLPGGRRIPVPLEGKLFVVSPAPGARHPEAVLALDSAGKVVARARP
jgi:hypothetical protein